MQKGDNTYTDSGCGGLHAVCDVGTTRYSYDDNGNVTQANLPEVGVGKTMAYNASNRVKHITNTLSISTGAPTYVVDFIYGGDGNRVVQSVGTEADGESVRTVYVGLGGTGKSLYERTTTATTTEHVHFIYAGGAHGGNAFALRAKTVAAGTQNGAGDAPPPPTETTKYYHFDHLGSVTAISDDVGNVVSPASGRPDTTLLGYDAWGARRNPDGSPATESLNLQAGHREFTSHETIPAMALVNMNGRVYDPELGRFLSPDPNVPVATDLQAYNRYSYVANNPLRYTDPTGYAWYSFLTSPMFWLSALETSLNIACVAASAGGCGVITAVILLQSAMEMAANGASFGQIVRAEAIGMFAGALGGAVGGSLTQGLGTLGQVVGGAVGGAVSAAISTAFLGGNLGQAVLVGAAMGALTAAETAGIQGQTSLSERDESEQRGDYADDWGHKSARANLGVSTDEGPPKYYYAGDRRAIQQLDQLEGTDPEYEYSARITGDKRGLNFDETKWSRYPDTGGDPELPDPTQRAPNPPAGPAGHYDYGAMHNHLVGEDFSVRDITSAVSNHEVAYMEGPAGLVLRFDPETGWVVPIRSSVDPFDPVATPYKINFGKVIQP